VKKPSPFNSFEKAVPIQLIRKSRSQLTQLKKLFPFNPFENAVPIYPFEKAVPIQPI
jgi:hypothetical protein